MVVVYVTYRGNAILTKHGDRGSTTSVAEIQKSKQGEGTMQDFLNVQRTKAVLL